MEFGGSLVMMMMMGKKEDQAEVSWAARRRTKTKGGEMAEG
jgi:hypothetical protein